MKLLIKSPYHRCTCQRNYSLLTMMLLELLMMICFVVGNNSADGGTATISPTRTEQPQGEDIGQPQSLTTTTTTIKVVSISYSDLESYFETYQSDEQGKGYCQQQQQQQQREGDSPDCTSSDFLASTLHQAIEDAFGNHETSLGFLEVSDVPQEMVELRRAVLHKAHDLANLPESELLKLEKPELDYVLGWSHGKEEFKPGIADVGKGSFYYNPFDSDENNNNNVFPPQTLLPDLETQLEQMTHFMAKVGLWIVKLIDEHLQLEIYQSLETCETAKARLLYYYPSSVSSENQNENQQQHQEWWCGWHKDHGSLTALLPGELIVVRGKGDDDEENDEKQDANNNDTEGNKAGLCIDSSSYSPEEGQRLHHVALPSTSVGFQLGETIQLMTHGKLRATPHGVKSPNSASSSSIGRASLALFLQPAAQQVLPPLPDESDHNIDESLRSRYRPTFGEFQQATTKAFQ